MTNVERRDAASAIVRKTNASALIALDEVKQRKPLQPRAEENPSRLVLEELDEAALQAPANVELVMECLTGANEIVETLGHKLKGEITKLRTELTEARCEARELRAEVAALRMVQEAQRVAACGERGEKGARGVPGRDGEPGKTGPRGEKGAKGERGVHVTAWEIDEASFTATPLMSDGKHGPALRLRGLFEAYDAAVSDIEDRDLAEAARTSRAEAERQVEAANWAK